LYPLWVPTDVLVVDVDRDGRADVVTLAQYSASAAQREGRLIVHRQVAAGAFAAAESYVVGTYPWKIAADDVDGDGGVDFVVTDVDGDTVFLLLQDPANRGHLSAPRPLLSLAGAYYDAAIGDLDGDGLPDIAVADSQKDSRHVWLLYQEPSRRGTFRPVVEFTVPGTSSSAVAAGDVNGDGRTDLLMCIAQASSGDAPDVTLGISLQQPDGSLGAVAPLAPQHGLNVRRLAVADYDGDGRNDLLAYFTPFSSNFHAQLTVVLQGPASGSFNAPADTSLQGVKGLDDAVFADLGDDGRPDAAVAGSFPVGSPSSVQSRLNRFTQSGLGGFALTSSEDLPIYASRVTAGDVDGDGRNELVVLGPEDQFRVIE
jgi:hypothetical protein